MKKGSKLYCFVKIANQAILTNLKSVISQAKSSDKKSLLILSKTIFNLVLFKFNYTFISI